MGAEDFLIGDSLNQALFGFGDAVCVKVIEWIATHYLNPLIEERKGGGVRRTPLPFPPEARSDR
jgi:DNA (cytosine-5)-methyltransferase 1